MKTKKVCLTFANQAGSWLSPREIFDPKDPFINIIGEKKTIFRAWGVISIAYLTLLRPSIFVGNRASLCVVWKVVFWKRNVLFQHALWILLFYSTEDLKRSARTFLYFERHWLVWLFSLYQKRNKFHVQQSQAQIDIHLTFTWHSPDVHLTTWPSSDLSLTLTRPLPNLD